MNREQYNQLKSYELPRGDNYDYCYFLPEESLEAVVLTKQIQAQSYVAMRITRPEALMTLADGTQILSPEATNPSGVALPTTHESYTQHALGIAKGTADFTVDGGHLVTWRKFYAPLDALPAYQFCKDELWDEGERYLRRVAASPELTLTEPEGLGKTKNASGGVVKEFIRAEVQRAFGHGEIWFMGLVEGTAYQSFVHNWGSVAVRQLGEPRPIVNSYTYDNVALVPTVMDIDNFYLNMAHDILSSDNLTASSKLLRNFVYMAEGMSDETLGEGLATFRAWARQTVEHKGRE